MNALTNTLIALEKEESMEILFDRSSLIESLSDCIEMENISKSAFGRCVESRLFSHAYYKKNVSEILFMRQKTISDAVEKGENAADVCICADSLIGLAEHLRGIEILSAQNEKNEKPYELLSVAIRSYERGNYRPALMAFNSLAAAGIAEAHYYLGKCYYEDKAVAQDNSKAANCFLKGVQAGSSYCIYYYSSCLMKGHGVKKNVEQGTELLLKAAAMGQEDAAFAVGYMYKDSPKDIKKAIEFLQMSADYGNWSAAITLVDLYYEDAKTTGNFRKTSQAKERLAKVADAETCYKIAQIYERGIGVPANLEKALNYSTKAAAKGHPAAAEMMTRVGNKKLGRT